MAGMIKTNVMRILERKNISYVPHSYPHNDGDPVDGLHAAELLGKDPSEVYKTLVAESSGREHYVFVIPVGDELDLKKAAKAAGEKAVALVHVKEINSLTGYIRGGCSPVGMKKLFRTFFDKKAESLKTVTVSAGRIGFQVELAPADLAACVKGTFADLTV